MLGVAVYELLAQRPQTAKRWKSTYHYVNGLEHQTPFFRGLPSDAQSTTISKTTESFLRRIASSRNQPGSQTMVLGLTYPCSHIKSDVEEL